MNEEFSKNEEVGTLEAEKKPAVQTLEAEKSSEAFANEILSKIEDEMNSEFGSQAEVKKIDSSIELASPAQKEGIKQELDLENKLNDLYNEVKTAGEEAKSKISVISGFSKAYHHPEYRKNIAKEIIEARKSGADAEAVRSDFYNKTEREKENFESQESQKERSVAEIMKEKDLLVVHAIPLHTQGQGSGRGSIENNRVFKNGMQQKINFEDSVEIIAGLSPTISTSIPSPDRHLNGLFNRTGVILGEGKILAAHAGDSGSVAHGLYKRIPKEAREGENRIHYSAVHDVDIDKVTPASKEVVRGESHNELTIESPKIAGLFIDMTILSREPNAPIEELKPRYGYEGSTYSDDGVKTEHWLPEDRIREIAKEERETEIQNYEKNLQAMREYSEKMNVPLYAFKNENGVLKKYRVDFGESQYSKKYLSYKNRGMTDDMIPDEYKQLIYDYTLIPVTAKDIYESKRNISDEERENMIKDIKSKGILSESALKEVDKKFKSFD